MSEPNSATFETTVTASGNNTGIVVPEKVIGQLAAGRRPAVLVDLNGYQYRNTVGVMGRQVHDQHQRRHPPGHRAQRR